MGDEGDPAQDGDAAAAKEHAAAIKESTEATAEAAAKGDDGEQHDAEALPTVPQLPGAEDWTFTKETQKRVDEVLACYVGTHNFHNFTSRMDPNMAQAKRYIISFKCGDPFTIDGREYVSLTVIGQSFILHQIRKMVGMALAVVRGILTTDMLMKSMQPSTTVATPLAPEV